MSRKPKPRLFVRFKLLLLERFNVSHCWFHQTLVVGFEGCQFTFTMVGDYVNVRVYGSAISCLLKPTDEFDLLARCELHGLFDSVQIKKFHGIYHRGLRLRERSEVV